MPYDENLILHGVGSGGALVDLDESDTVAVLTDVNADGNKIIDLKKTPNDGLVAVLILTEEADADAYSKEATISIEDSDHMDRGWAEVTRFPRLYAHIRRIWVKCTTAFDAADIGQIMTAEGGSTGILLAFDDALLAEGGYGYIYVERDLVDDVFTDIVDQTMTTTGAGGVGTVAIVCVGTEPNIQMQPHTFTRRFSTNKRYIRCNCEDVADSLGLCWILLTNDAPVSPDPF